MKTLLKGRKVKVGDLVCFVYINARHKISWRRVVSARTIDPNTSCRREKFADLSLKIAKTILEPFGFTEGKCNIHNKPLGNNMIFSREKKNRRFKRNCGRGCQPYAT